MEGVTGPKAALIRGLVRGIMSGFRRVPEAAVVKLAHNVLGKNLFRRGRALASPLSRRGT